MAPLKQVQKSEREVSLVMNVLALITVCAAIVGLIVAFSLAAWVKKAPQGNEKMVEISGFIREGAFAFLKREYKIMVIVIVVPVSYTHLT